MVRTTPALFLLFALLGCTAEGQGGFYYVDSDDDDAGPPDVVDDDDDDDQRLRDWTGVETLRIDYHEEAEAEGAVDCAIAWDVVATLEDDQGDLCLPCDAIWRVELTRRGGDACGDFLPEVEDPYTRRFGVVMLDESEFNAFRTTWSADNPWGDNARRPLIRTGRGLLEDDGTFAWGAHDGDSRDLEGREGTLSFAGEGAM